MNHPLEKYILIAEDNFISRLEDKFYTTYCQELEKGLYISIEKENSRIKYSGVDMDGNDFGGYLTFSHYFITEYNKLETETRSNIDDFLFELLDEPKQRLFIKNTIAKLQELQNAIAKISTQTKYEACKAILLDKLSAFIQILQDTHYQGKQQSSNSILKIQWLGKTNVLATLIYDLWKGQDKIKQPSTKPLLKADKKDLEQLLINNFIDSKGNPLTISTVSDYLNKSKPGKRAKKGIRIELEY